MEVARVFTVGIWQRGDFRNLADAKWMLFSVKEDFSESSDVADKFPEKPKELERMWRIEAPRPRLLPRHPSQNLSVRREFRSKEKTKPRRQSPRQISWESTLVAFNADRYATIEDFGVRGEVRPVPA